MKHLNAFIILCLLWLSPNLVTAQKEGNIWLFGHMSGLDFNAGSPVAVSTSILVSTEGCASICDRTTGSILFYSDGQKVYDRTNTVMMNGNGILGNELTTTTQGVGIFPIPERPNLYYLFTLSALHVTGGYLRYSVIDMTLNGGLGAVLPAYKNIVIDSMMSEKMVLSSICGQSWLITHHRDQPFFYAFTLDSSIAMSAPVVSVSGTGRPGKFGASEMTINRTGNMLALANYSYYTTSRSTVELYDFDHASGITSNVKVLDTTTFAGQPYGIHFSPDGSKLYVAASVTGLFQYDLSLLPSVAAVRAARYAIFRANYWGIRLGPDNMLYVITSDELGHLSRIRNPNIAGVGCGFEYYISSPLLPRVFGLSMGMYINGLAGYNTLTSTHKILICDTDRVIYNSPYIHSLWSDGDTSRSRILNHAGTYLLYGDYGNCNQYVDSIIVTTQHGSNVTRSTDTSLCIGNIVLYAAKGYDSYLWQSGEARGSLTVNTAGTFWVRAQYHCDVLTDTFHVTKAAINTTYYHKDTVVCLDNEVLLRVPDTYNTYLWQDGSATDTLIVHSPQTAAKAVCRLPVACKEDIYDFSIYFPDAATDILPPDTVICSGDTLAADLTITGASYLWQDGDRSGVRSMITSGIYWIMISADGCILSDTTSLLVKEIPGNIGSDTTLCNGDVINLVITPDTGTYLWQDGSTLNQHHVTHPGIYSVRINNDGCETTRSVDIRYKDCTICVAIDNAFTPNNDQLNDEFKVHYRCPVKQQLLLLYNRWGKQVFRSESTAPTWDGRINGIDATPGTYFYLLKVTFDIQGSKEEIYKGDVTLIR